MSHHLDSPASRADPRLNVTDTYVFDGTRGTVLVMLTNTSLAQGDALSRGFHSQARYELKVHTDGAARETRTYRFTFGARDATGRQTVTLHQLTGDDAGDDAAEGQRVAAGRTQALLQGEAGAPLRAWAGHALDPFFLDLDQLSLITAGLHSKRRVVPEGDAVQPAHNSFEGSRVLAIVVEVDTVDHELRAGRDIAVWAVTKLATDAGGWRQVNRAAIPMMWPLLRATGDDDSSRYAADTAAHPADDRTNDGALVRELVCAAAKHAGSPDADAHADALSARLLPDLLPYRVGTAAAFEVTGFNGRALADNAPEVMYSLITDSRVATGLPPAVAAATRSGDFPYVVATT